jgi:putative transposase
LVERDNEAIAVARQCELLRLSRSSYYYSSSRDDEYNLELMRLLDEQYMNVPFYGVRRLTAWLRALGEPEAGQGTDAADGTLDYLSQ